MKKKIFIFIGALILGFSLYISWEIYQTSQLELISVDAIQTFELSTERELVNETVIHVEADVDRFEALEMAQTIVIDDTLYLMIYKWPAIPSVNNLEFDLEHEQSLEEVDQISIVYGELYTGEGTERGFSYNDLINHPNQEAIWTKGDSHD